MARRLPPPPALPELVEGEYGVTEHWLDGGFRRVLVVEDESGKRSIVVVDLFSEQPNLKGESGELHAATAAGVKLLYESIPARLLDKIEKTLGVRVEGELVLLEAGSTRQLVSARLRVEGPKPGRDAVEKIYRLLVSELEGRDPAASPLETPEPVERVYRSRGLTR
ncbi:MAG: hypothetical protein GXO15_01850 [Crenarchaeota archaeon]|nr:hypothetical protein [Thermoproteota archaeon]